MTKYALTIVLFIFVILSYILGILAFSSKEARDHKWQEYYKKYEGKLKKRYIIFR